MSGHRGANVSDVSQKPPDLFSSNILRCHFRSLLRRGREGVTCFICSFWAGRRLAKHLLPTQWLRFLGVCRFTSSHVAIQLLLFIAGKEISITSRASTSICHIDIGVFGKWNQFRIDHQETVLNSKGAFKTLDRPHTECVVCGPWSATDVQSCLDIEKCWSNGY